VNLAEPFHALAQTLVQADGQASAIGPGRWHVLFGDRPRPLLLPVGTYGFQEKCLRYFVGNSPRALYARALLKANSLFPGAGLLPEFRLPRVRGGSPSLRLPVDEPAHGAIQIGSAGPYQKASVLLMTEWGEEYALAKIALVPSADHRVRAEAAWLRELEGVPQLRDRLPCLLAEGAAGNGRRYLVMTLAPCTRMTRAFTPAHIKFLGTLGRARLEAVKFSVSPCSLHLEQTLGRLETRAPREALEPLRAAVRDCLAFMHHWTGPFVIAQGDFAPWNIRVHDDRVFVFDWEYARHGSNPLADVFNYLLIQRTLSGRGMSNEFLASVARRGEETARAIYPEWKWPPQVISALLLAYLIEILLSYSQASGRLERGHRVIASYIRLIDRRREWMAA
jgi:hypothetical protein